MKKYLLTFCLTLTSSLAISATEQQEKQQALNVLKKYASTIACATTFDKNSDIKTTLNDVYSVNYDPEEGFSTYYIFWGGDKGCNGGSGTWTSFITEVARFSNSRPFLVYNDDALNFDNQDSWRKAEQLGVSNINSRFIESVEQVSPTQFKLIGYTFSDNEFGGNINAPNSAPPNKIEFTVTLTDTDGWQITKRKLLAQES